MSMKAAILCPGIAHDLYDERALTNSARNRVEVTGLRPLPLPHHRTCGLPHPAVEPSGFKLPQDPMEHINPNAGDGRIGNRGNRGQTTFFQRKKADLD